MLILYLYQCLQKLKVPKSFITWTLVSYTWIHLFESEPLGPSDVQTKQSPLPAQALIKYPLHLPTLMEKCHLPAEMFFLQLLFSLTVFIRLDINARQVYYLLLIISSTSLSLSSFKFIPLKFLYHLYSI